MPAIIESDIVTTEDIEDILEDANSGLGNPWQTVLYDCTCHSYDQVADALVVAISCTLEQGYQYAWIVDHHGQASVYHGERKECERVMFILSDAGLRSEVEKS